MNTTYNQLKKELKQNKFSPLYLFTGEEEFLKKEIIDLFMDTVVEKETADFNKDIFYGNDADIKNVLSTLSTFPMFAASRLVVIHNIDKFSISSQKGLSEYCASPSPTTCLIMTTLKNAPKTKFFKELMKHSKTANFHPFRERETMEWIEQYAKDEKLKLTQEAIALIYQIYGNELRVLSNEIDKLAIYIADKKDKKVDVEQVLQLRGSGQVHNVFELTKELGKKNQKSALNLLNQLILNGESPVNILYMIIRHYTILWKVKTLSKDNPPNQIASKASISPYFLNEYQKQSKHFSGSQYSSIFEWLYNADRQLKTSSGKPEFILQMLTYKLCTV